MKVNVEWKGNMAFEGKGDSGHSVLLDAAPQVGGQNQGPRPMETLLFALGGCTGMDVVSILKKMRQEIETFHMEITGDRASEHPKRYTKINVHYDLTGPNLNEEKVRKAIKLTQETYCSVSKSLNAEVTYSFSINGKKFEPTI
ncbi:putative redox protein [Tepidibacillus fermentans]|uniref:Putative redox protein n=2 Tax=Tepidibacillus fermentans TaxID=1281767 RepID=A0A4R3KE62_9BACI|nr:OsmC family protein [Tepidibacillus fermentans]TCS81507.1 putative redox protein [Tepidibacillus fermentans]